MNEHYSHKLPTIREYISYEKIFQHLTRTAGAPFTNMV